MSLFDSVLAQKSRSTRIAVVGASADPNKYGNIIPADLLRHGYTVLPVNPRETEILGLPVTSRIADLPRPVHVVNVVTPPAITRSVLTECAAAGFENVWLQPGSFDDATLEHARGLRTPDGRPLSVESDACIMVVARMVRA